MDPMANTRLWVSALFYSQLYTCTCTTRAQQGPAAVTAARADLDAIRLGSIQVGLLSYDLRETGRNHWYHEMARQGPHRPVFFHLH